MRWSPHKYQEKAIQFMIERSEAGLFLSPGLGKTSITLAAYKILRLRGFVHRMLVIAPLRPCYSVWPKEVAKWDDFKGLSVGILHGPKKESVLKENHDIYVINPEGLRWLFGVVRGALPWEMLVVDECFPKGTKIATPVGEKDISEVVEGDVVLTAIGSGAVSKVVRRTTRNLVRLTTEAGVIVSTPEHPIFTTRGWRCAKNCEGYTLLDEASLSCLREGVSGATQDARAWEESRLLEILLSEADVDAKTGTSREDGGGNVNYNGRDDTLEQGKTLGRGHIGETSSGCEKKQSTGGIPSNSWRERNGSIEVRSTDAHSITENLHMELPNSIGWKARRLSYELQSRFWGSEYSNGNRSGRCEPQQRSEKSEGLEEKVEARGTRVVRVESIECGSEEDVWNLEVTGHPSYIANGVLVHNCSKFKAVNTQRFKTLKPHLSKFKRRYILTGSPAANSLLDLFGQMYVMDLGKTFGPYITHYRTTFFHQSGYGGYDWTLNKGSDKAIYDRIAPRVLRMSAEDYLDMPELIVEDILVELPSKAKAMYDQLENALRLDFKEGRVVAANAAVASMKCRQIANGGIYLDGADRAWEQVHEAKSEALEDLLEELEGQPALIAYDFHHDLERIRKVTGKETPHIGGGVSGKIADAIIDKWNRGELRQLIGHPQSMGHGLNLQEAGRAVIWYSLTWSLELYEQFIQRVWRQGQKERVFVYRIIAKGTVDEAVISALGRKDKTQSALFDALKSYWK